MLVLMELSVLHPRIGDEQAVAVVFLVHELPVQQFAVLLHDALFYHGVAGIDAIHHVQVRIAGTHLNDDGLAVVGKLRGRGIEPVAGLGGRLRIVKTEHHKGHVYRVVFTDCLQTVLTALTLNIKH